MGCRKGPSKSLREDFVMSRVPSLSSPFLLGFDEIERALDRVVKGADGYPPYNIERCDRDSGQPERLRIKLAVGGFHPPQPAVASRTTRPGNTSTAASPRATSSALLCWRRGCMCWART